MIEDFVRETLFRRPDLETIGTGLLGIVFWAIVITVGLSLYRVNKAKKKGLARRFGEPVAATPGAPCELCGAPLGERAHRLADLVLCDPCLAGDFQRRLDHRGFCIQEVSTATERQSDRQGRARAFTRSFALREGPEVEATFYNAKARTSLVPGKVLRTPAELLTGDEAFDRDVYIEAHPSATLTALLDQPAFRLAIREYLDFGGAGFVLCGPRITQEEGFWGAPEQGGRARCCGAVLLHHLERAATHAPADAHVTRARWPDLSTLLGRKDHQRGIEIVKISGAVIDDLREMVGFQQQQAVCSLQWLTLTRVRLGQDSLADLAEIPGLTRLTLEHVEGLSDLSALHDLENLEEVEISGGSWDADELERLRQALPDVRLNKSDPQLARMHAEVARRRGET